MSIYSNITNSKCREIVLYEPKETSPSSLRKRADAAYRRFLEKRCMGSLETRYLDTYKALHVGGKETLESRMIQFAAITYPTHSVEETVLRHANYNKITQFLSHLTNEELEILLTNAHVIGSGIGGVVLSTELEGITVFIKKIPLSTIEQQNSRSTSNLFKLPSNYQYGVGSMGFGVWREISALETTTQWVLNGECQNFPLMYHSRVMQRPILSPPLTEEDVQARNRYIEYWDGASTVGVRGDAVATASADVVVFMEYIPQTLAKWLSVENGSDHLTEPAMARVEQELHRVIAFMKLQGFLHFDAHCHNIQANNNHIYFADFGLAMSQEFDLSPEEKDFFEKHRDYDRYYAVNALFWATVSGALGEEEGDVVLDSYRSTGKIVVALPPAITSIVQRYLPIAAIMGDFLHGLQKRSKSTPFPEEALAREWNKI